ncbi:MAG: FAD-dependent oxidoreductase [Silvibacterium sp.]
MEIPNALHVLYGWIMKLQKTIAIIGGGVSGALTAYHLIRRGAQAKVILIDPCANPGLGLAYSTPSYRHLLNVPAGKISALPDQPKHFLDWLQKKYDARMTETDFAPRAVFGRYVQSLLKTVPNLDHRQTAVLDCHVAGEQATLDLSDGTQIVADAVVLATGNFDPAPLRGVAEETVSNGTYCHSAWEGSTYANLAPDAPVALIGSGLTAVDVLLRLREVGHRGQIIAISRHGIFPHRHANYLPLRNPAVAGTPPTKVRELLRAVHHAIRAGAEWRAVIDSLRGRTNELWMSLPLNEQRRFRRHLQRRWEVVRHRMAPPIADQVEAELEAGTLTKHRGSLRAVLPSLNGARVQFRTNLGEVKEVIVARVINCTGPNMNYRRVGSPLLNSLFAQGLIVAGPHGSALWTSESGALRDQDGSFSKVLFHVGPGRQGTLLESIAVPELRHQAADLAELLAREFASHEQDVTSNNALADTLLTTGVAVGL